MVKLYIKKLCLPQAFFPGLFLLGMCCAQPCMGQEKALYRVTLTDKNPRLVKVTAELSVDDYTLQMNPRGATHLADRWATFVRNLTAKNEAGGAIALQYQGKARWQLPEPLPKRITLDYEIAIEHDQGRWPFGHDEAAYAKADCVFFLGRAVFIASSGLKHIKVRFDLPMGWRVSTPWQNVEGESTLFAIAQAEELTDAGILAGRHLERRLKAGKFEILLAVGQELKQSLSLFEETINPVLAAAAKFFGGSPVINGARANKFLIIANRDTFDGGGSFPHTQSMLFKEIPRADNRSEWAYIIIHEMLHSWNGQSFRSAGQEYWFVEGFTDYLTYLLEARAGIISEQELFKVFARKYDEYLAVAGRTGMRAAGINKSRNYDLIYSGGFTVALALDIEILKSTNGERSLRDFMQQMYREFAVSGNRYKLDDLMRVAKQTMGSDTTPFFRDFVEGTKVLTLETYLEHLGLGIRKQEGSRTVLKLPDAPQEKKKLLAKLLSRA